MMIGAWDTLPLIYLIGDGKKNVLDIVNLMTKLLLEIRLYLCGYSTLKYILTCPNCLN